MDDRTYKRVCEALQHAEGCGTQGALGDLAARVIALEDLVREVKNLHLSYRAVGDNSDHCTVPRHWFQRRDALLEDDHD